MRSRYEKVKGCVVFVHGAGGGAWEWSIWQRVFRARGWEVIANDLRPAADGLARTGVQDYTRQIEDWVRGIASRGTHCEPLPLVLVGASLGGLLATIAAPRIEPATLVLVNPIPPAGIEARPTYKDYPDIVPWGSARSFASTRRAMADADDAACWFAYRRWRDESGVVLREAVRGIAVAVPLMPALVFASERDDDVPAAASRALAAAWGAEFRLLPGASHLGPLLGRIASSVAGQAVDWCEDKTKV